MAKKAKKTFSATVIKPSTIGDEGSPPAFTSTTSLAS
jgi:hypothetical protein